MAPGAARDVVRASVEAWRLNEGPALSVLMAELPPPVVTQKREEEATSPLSNSEALAGLVELSLTRLREILSLPLPDPKTTNVGYEEVAAMARVHLSATEKVLNTQVRVDDNVLKRRVASQHTTLLRELLLHEQQNSRTIEAQAAE